MKVYDLIRAGKLKRYLRTRHKLDYEGLVSHITQRAVGDTPLFLEKSDYLYMLKLFKETAINYDLSIFAFCLMSNHVHILLRQREANLTKSMHHLFTCYAIYFNHKYNRKGHLFCGPFGQAACFDDYYLLAASVYIHLNPVRAAICSNYRKYPWSTWRLYCNNGTFNTYIDWRFILNMLDRNIVKARQKYRGLLVEALKYKQREVLEHKKALGRFGIWIKKKFPDLIVNGGMEQDKAGYMDNETIDRIIKDLRNKKRLNTPTELQARAFAVRQLRSRGYSVQEIIDLLGISKSSVYNSLKTKTE